MIKKYLPLLLFFISSITLYAQHNDVLQKPAVDERVELLSIVFRLAGAGEYSDEDFKLYTNAINTHFEPYKEHEIMSFIKKLRYDKGTGYDAVMKMAIHIGPAPQFEPLVPFTDDVPEQRWGKENAEQFLVLLRKFYEDADCESFFVKNRELYGQLAQHFLPVYDMLDLDWYLTFYGVMPKEKFKIVIGAGNGGGNYGPDIVYPDGTREVYAIMGTWSTDSSGMAAYNTADYFPTLLHEFNHSFINHLNDKYRKELQKPGRAIFKHVEEQMYDQAYGNWLMVLNEALVRAAVIKYMKDHNFEKQAIADETLEQLNRGFIWIEELVALLEAYSYKRGTYPTLESYMPVITDYYKTRGKDFRQFKRGFDTRKPRVTHIAEFNNGNRRVDPTLTTITIHFDRPLQGKGYSVHYGEKGEECYPEVKGITYSPDRKAVNFDVRLQPEKEYQFVLVGRRFKSEDGIGIDDYVVDFKTGK